MTTYVVGTGILNWNRGERITDRYGYVHLTQEPMDPHAMEGDTASFLLARFAGTGRLVARICATRQSPHIGDWARGLFPSTPTVGDEIVLGHGTLDYAEQGVGLLPADGRDTDWLDPTALYRCHEQTVTLLFVPGPP